MKTRLLGAVSACVFIFGLSTSTTNAASLMNFEFTGIIRSFNDLGGGVPDGTGTPFSGFIKYEAGNAESIDFQTSNPGILSAFAISQSGCVSYVNGVCSNDRGTGTPVVVDYELNWIGGTVKPWEYSLDFQDASRRVNTFNSPPALVQERWEINRNQFRMDTEIINGDRTTNLTKRTLLFAASSPDTDFLSGPIDDFDQGFDPIILLSNSVQSLQLINFDRVETCVDNECTTVHNPGSYEFSGYLTSSNFTVIPIPRAIDIKPGSRKNKVNPKSRGGIWVAVLSDTDPESPFDPSSQVDIPTVEFGPDGAKAIRHRVRDVNHDGLGDLLLRFKIRRTGIECGDTEATLTGQTYESQSITGTDSIKTVGCRKKHH